MNVSITFRHVDSSDALKRYSEEKIAKLQKFLRQPMTAKVTLSLDRLKQVAEVQISSGGEHLEAKEATNDMYASIDIVLGKLERQIRGAKGAAKAKVRGAETVRKAQVSRVPDLELEAGPRAKSAAKLVKKPAKKRAAKAKA
ncbi:MAG TPA: ribosome-associated translation inhibitor RaiA [Polyangiaceae bacterium]|jgi:putative sigma-54 modulation protein|nr:ribosome-associated translation inhibitor RaiA [Polyangiaceae bacterium]